MGVNKSFHVDVEVNISRFAQELAGKNNEEQAVFFNEFFATLLKRTGDKFKFQIQLHSIREGEATPCEKLSDLAKEGLSCLVYEE